MTLSQLRAFALVARLGSLTAAAAELGVSEPAVSAALASLRNDLGDPLFVRSGGGIAFTAGGRRLAAHADEIVGLADQARREVAEASTTSPGSLRVAATAAFSEHAAAALLDAFTRRVPGSAVELLVRPGLHLLPCLVERSSDITLGARPEQVDDVALDVVPFLRYQRVLVAVPTHPLVRRGGDLSLAEAAGHPWLAGQAGIEEHSEEGRWLRAQGTWPDVVRLTSETDALDRVREGDGPMLALGHVVRADLRRGSLALLPVAGTPVTGLWWASTLRHEKVPSEARTLQRFVTTPDATAAMVAPPGGVRPGRSRGHRALRVALWS